VYLRNSLSCWNIINFCTKDESIWAKVLTYTHNLETKQQLLQWKSLQSPDPKNATQVKSTLIFFWLQWHCALWICTPPPPTPNCQSALLDVLCHLWGKYSLKTPPEMMTDWFIMTIVSTHTHTHTHTHRLSNGSQPRTKLLWSPISLTFRPCSLQFLTVSKMKLKHDRKICNYVLEIQQNSQQVLTSIMKKEFETFNNGRITGFCIWSPNGSTLKGTGCKMWLLKMNVCL